MKRLGAFIGVTGLALLAAIVGLGAMAAGPSIEGNYVLESRDLPDGKQVRAPDIIGMVNFTKDRRNFNIYWMEGGKPVSIATISSYTLSGSEYTEKSWYYVENNAPGGAGGLKVVATPESGSAPVTVKDGKISFKLPLHGEPDVVFDAKGFTATRPGAFVDHWKKIE